MNVERAIGEFNRQSVIALSSDHNPPLGKRKAGPGQRTRASWSGSKGGITEAY
jgi:hypothetical protein